MIKLIKIINRVINKLFQLLLNVPCCQNCVKCCYNPQHLLNLCEVSDTVRAVDQIRHITLHKSHYIKQHVSPRNTSLIGIQILAIIHSAILL